jgi:hypothetical protein
MDHHIKEYYSQFHDETPKGNFHKVIALNENHAVTWSTACKMVPSLCKGWFELAQLSPEDKIEFTRDFWLSKLPYHPKVDDFLSQFFASLDDIYIYLIQRKFDDPFEANLVYSLSGDAGFFRGSIPASDAEILALKNAFPDVILPADYLAFLQIHNGFSKTTDVTGISPSAKMPLSYQTFQQTLEDFGPVLTSKGKDVNPKALIPFYESFGMPFYQCFWAEWYPEQEMGNVYYSGVTGTIIDVESKDPSSESMAFPTFLDWLMFYMEKIE